MTKSGLLGLAGSVAFLAFFLIADRLVAAIGGRKRG